MIFVMSNLCDCVVIIKQLIFEIINETLSQMNFSYCASTIIIAVGWNGGFYHCFTMDVLIVSPQLAS